MRKKRRRPDRIVFILLAALCLSGAFFAGDIIRAVERHTHPRDYADTVARFAAEYAVDKNAIFAIICTESGFRPDAESAAGARGLMQITEETFDWIKMKIAPSEPLTFDDLYDAEINIRFGAYLLSVCLSRYENDLPTAAAAYHSGMGLVDNLLKEGEYSSDGKTLSSFPYAQMNRYVYKVKRNYKLYCELYA